MLEVRTYFGYKLQRSVLPISAAFSVEGGGQGVVEAMLGDGKADRVFFIRGGLGEERTVSHTEL